MNCFICCSDKDVRFDVNLAENICADCLKDLCSGEQDSGVIGCPDLCANRDRVCDRCVEGSQYFPNHVSRSTGDME